MKVNFKEEQMFGQWWLWLILGALLLLPVYGLYKQVILEESFGTKPTSNLALLFMFVVILLLFGLIWWMRLRTEIDQKGIRVTFSPLDRQNILWIDVQSAKVIDYGFVGGWGIRLWTKYGTVYNTQGKIGLAIILKNGKKFLVGTQKELELKNVIQQIDLLQ